VTRIRIAPEIVLTSVAHYGFGGWARRGRLVNGVGTVKWECVHRHRDNGVAVRCAEAQRARWIREGRAA